MKNIFPTKSQLLFNFINCINWEEKYMYIIDLGKLLPQFPKSMYTEEFLLSGCQSQTWIVLIMATFFNLQNHSSNNPYTIELYGDSDSSIVKGLIAIIFSLYQELTLDAIINLDARPFLKQLQLNQNLTASRSQGITAILNSIHFQAKKLKKSLQKIQINKI